jgi:hypothetical protein
MHSRVGDFIICGYQWISSYIKMTRCTLGSVASSSMVFNGFIFYGYVNMDPVHFREHWKYSGAPGRSSTITSTPIGSADSLEFNKTWRFLILSLPSGALVRWNSRKHEDSLHYHSHRERWFAGIQATWRILILSMRSSKPQGTCECCNWWQSMDYHNT